MYKGNYYWFAKKLLFHLHGCEKWFYGRWHAHCVGSQAEVAGRTHKKVTFCRRHEHEKKIKKNAKTLVSSEKSFWIPVVCENGGVDMNPIITAEHFEKLKKQFPEIPSYPASEGKIKVPAGWLIEQCGFKGKNHGPVGVYEKQALVLVNLGDARGHEIALVAESIRTAVKDRFGIELMPEVKYVG